MVFSTVLLGLNTQIAKLLIMRRALLLFSALVISLSLALGAWGLLQDSGAPKDELAWRWETCGGCAFQALFLMLAIILTLVLYHALGVRFLEQLTLI